MRIVEKTATWMRHPASVEETQELVAAERRIGAEEQELRLARLEVGHLATGPDRQAGIVDPIHEDVVGAVADEPLGDPGARIARDHQEDEEEDARERDPVALEPPPDLLPVPAGLDLPDVADFRGVPDLGRAEVVYGSSRRHIAWAAGRRITESGFLFDVLPTGMLAKHAGRACPATTSPLARAAAASPGVGARHASPAGATS